MSQESPEQRPPQDPLLLGRYRTHRYVYQGKTREAVWWSGSVVSLLLNAVLLAVIIFLLARIRELQELQLVGTKFANQALAEAYFNFMLMEDATINTTVVVEDTIPVRFDLVLNTDTIVVITEPTYIDGASIDLRTGGLNIIEAPTNILLPRGTRLPIRLDLVVPVDQTVPVELQVPVKIALKDTDLVTPFRGLQELLWPYLSPESQKFLCEEGRGFNCAKFNAP